MILNAPISILTLLGHAWASPTRDTLSGKPSKIVTKIVYRDTPVGDLTNLPTLASATYCTQTLADGKELLVTKTGTTCPILSASRTTTSSFADSSAPSHGSSSGLPGSSDQGLDSKCSIFQKKVTDAGGKISWTPTDQETGSNMCMNYCSEKIKALLDQDQVASSACLAFENPIQWQDYGIAGTQIALGSCVCNNPLLDELVHNFTSEALPAIGEAAQVAAWTFENEQAAAGGFQSWLEKPTGAAGSPDNPSTWLPDKICGNKYTPEEGEKVFAAFDIASSSIGAGALWKSLPKDMHWPPPFPKASGSLDDMLGYLDGHKPRPKGDTPKEKPDPPKSAPPTDDPPKSKVPEKGTSAKACTRTRGKRAPGKGQQGDCADKVTVTHILNSKTVEAKNTIAKLCDWAAWPEACAHYYSAIHADKANLGKSRFTCEDSNNRVEQTYTKDWEKQHDLVWRKFKNPKFVFNGKQQKNDEKRLICEADEWPPAYFVPREGEGRPEWGQRIRWIPKEDNGGAGNLWRSFCSDNDGGEGNGQRVRKRKKAKNGQPPEPLEIYSQVPINKDLLEGEKIPPPNRKREGKDGTITEDYDMLTFTRAVFEIKFNFGDSPPSEKNDWLLKENPCWPEDIAPEDPGFVLLTNDPYYNSHPEAKATVASYAEPPSRKRFDEANAVRVKQFGPESKIADDGVPAADPPPPKAQKPNPASGSKFRRKRLELVGDHLHLRDFELNVTRPLTDEEIKENVEVTRCKDRKCEREEEQEDSLILLALVVLLCRLRIARCRRW
ncbi:hypothetical protein M409DRAFT_49876 [Zasmidium cellare ATCC 36951]|uniref:Uncharacterized protein n=1 Tax=Zasmidium cellare ATCC 36951 TaxID=1080233 RepID=A0A6A6CY78_ZASCE|nr:uncharacterized protein M409DRAFT_49876 [Zasmidium cellare ATCC 36951]KAF2172134.1 hypothetical protein M409DRAFT_49876 [Zasmidium cellare ATCC 36951]